MSFASVCVTVACLIIVGSFSILMYNVNIMVEELNQTNEVLAYVDSELSDAEAKSVGTKINMLDNILEANCSCKSFKVNCNCGVAFDGQTVCRVVLMACHTCD